jgi:hypothetical protein
MREMKRPLQATLALLMLVGLVTPIARAARLGPAAEELIEKTHEAELGLSTSRTQEARAAALKAFAQYLEGTLQKLPDKNPDEETRRLRASLWSFKSYVGKIVPGPFDAKNCGESRAAIMLSFSPHSDAPAYVPGEARESLKLLALLCQKPELAEIPGQSPEPPPQLKKSGH